MNKKEVLQVIRNPKSLSELKLKEIEKIANDFPYFQGAHTLVAIGHEKFQNPAIRKSLSKAALYATDRKFLKQLLDSLKSETAQPAPAGSAAAEQVKAAPVEVEAKELVQVKKPEVSASSTAPELADPIVTKPANPSFEEMVAEVDSVVSVAPADLEAETQSRIHPDPASDIGGEANKPKEKDLNEVLYLSHDDLLKEVFTNLEALKKTKTEYLEVERKIEDAEFEEAKTKAVDKANNKYLTKKEKNGASSKTPKTPTAAAKRASKSEKRKPGPNPVKADQNKIIEEFIKKNPSIKTQNPDSTKNKAVKTVDLSAPSVQLKDDLATENMALIFVKQGRIEKAIEVYRKLIWKYPDKKAYFAAQIENLQK